MWWVTREAKIRKLSRRGRVRGQALVNEGRLALKEKEAIGSRRKSRDDDGEKAVSGRRAEEVNMYTRSLTGHSLGGWVISCVRPMALPCTLPNKMWRRIHRSTTPAKRSVLANATGQEEGGKDGQYAPHHALQQEMLAPARIPIRIWRAPKRYVPLTPSRPLDGSIFGGLR